MTSPPLSPPPPTATHQHLPADRCYWATLEVPTGLMKHPDLLPSGLLMDVESQIPAPLEDLHIVAAPFDTTHVLVCAVPRTELENIDPTVITLTPDVIPLEFGVHTDPASLNLLIGEFRSPTLLAASRSRHALLAATFLLCACCVSFGLHRRTEHARTRAAEHARQTEALLEQLTVDRREASLTAAVEQARGVAALAERVRPLRDAAVDMEAILSAWPTSVAGAKPQALSVTSEGTSFALTVEGDSTSFLHAFKPPAMFTLDEPRLVAVGPLTRLNLRLRPAAVSADRAGERGTPSP